MCIFNIFYILTPQQYEYLKSKEAKEKYEEADKNKEYEWDLNTNSYIDGDVFFGFHNKELIWSCDDYPGYIKLLIEWYGGGQNNGNPFMPPVHFSRVFIYNQLQTDAANCTDPDTRIAFNRLLSQLKSDDIVVLCTK